jgi:anti-sigma B factor antagonist
LNVRHRRTTIGNVPFITVTRSPPATGTVRLAVEGEVDLANADELREALVTVLDDRTVERLVVDLAGVGFLDSRGVAALAAGYRATRTGPAELLVVNCRPNVRLVLEITGLDKVLTGDCRDPV